MRAHAIVLASCLVQLSATASPSASQVDSKGHLRGLDPALLSKYEPDADGWWHCLDGKRYLPFSAVNDDYCDCEDGSDEPGTSACVNSTFHCKNDGHLPSLIRPSQVNDGICDEECCDGSDEWDSDVSCPNVCEEKGRTHRATVAADAKVRKTGSKIRSSYISHANAERARLEAQLEGHKRDVEVRQAELEAARLLLESYEEKDKDWVERKKQSPLYKSLMEHRRVLNLVKIQGENSLNDLEILKGIMRKMSEEYNPNYQDMAVKHAIDTYEIRHRIRPDVPFTDQESGIDDHIQFEENSAHKEALPIIDDEEVEALLATDVTALLFEHKDEQDEANENVFRIEHYLPESFLPHYANARDTLLAGMVKLGIISSAATSNPHPEGQHTHVQRAAYLAAQNAEFAATEEVRKTRLELEKLDHSYGPQAEWYKLENTCIEKEQGEYTYSLCFFGQATQKKGNSATKLGAWEDWSRDPHAVVGSESYYSTQFYTKGQHCWNGPDRQVKVELSCGRDNALLSISEPEKCEYLFKATTPALCWPDAAWDKHRQGAEVKQEL